MTRASIATGAAGLATVAVLGGVLPAAASWSVLSGSAQAYTAARILPRGGTPTGTASGTTVSLSWPSRAVAPGVPVAGYRVARYHASTGATQPVLPGCAGPLTATSCTEAGVPAGSWRYTVRPVHGTEWTGAESAQSTDVIVLPVPAPTIVSTPNNPTNQTSAAFSFSDSQGGVTFECALDAAAYAACTSPTTYPGPLSAVTHTFAVRAKDGNGVYSAATSYTWKVDTTAPSATDVQATNTAGGTAGKMESGDTLTLSHSEPINPATISGGWTGGALPVTVRVNKGNGQSNDDLTFYDSTNTTAIASLGTVNLGQRGYVTSSITFSATMVMSGSQVVVTLGAPSNSTRVGTVGTAGDLQWTTGNPPVTVKDLAGNPLGNPATVLTEQHTTGSDVDF